MRGKHGSFTCLFNSEFFLGRRATEAQTVNKLKDSAHRNPANQGAGGGQHR
jgi:hypothetical protein